MRHLMTSVSIIVQTIQNIYTPHEEVNHTDVVTVLVVLMTWLLMPATTLHPWMKWSMAAWLTTTSPWKKASTQMTTSAYFALRQVESSRPRRLAISGRGSCVRTGACRALMSHAQIKPGTTRCACARARPRIRPGPPVPDTPRRRPRRASKKSPPKTRRRRPSPRRAPSLRVPC